MTPTPASARIDQRIRELEGWRGETLALVRARILAADPAIAEEWKWDVPVWSRDGIICTGEAYAKVVKLTFARGASIPDPAHLFNSSLEGNTRRAIDIREGERLDARAFKALIKAAIAVNGRSADARKAKRAPAAARQRKPAATAKPVRLLSGGNPQIAMADGNAPVQAYIAALPGWKREAARNLDALIVRALPGVRKAVKWNSPLYGVEGNGWFLGVHAFTRYLKVNFFQGAHLRPLPPVPSKDKDARYFHIEEGGALDEAQVAKWVKQAAKLPGFLREAAPDRGA